MEHLKILSVGLLIIGIPVGLAFLLIHLFGIGAVLILLCSSGILVGAYGLGLIVLDF